MSTGSRRIVQQSRPTIAPAVDGSQLPERTICLVLDLKKIGNRRKVQTAQIEVDADKEMISVSKQLLAGPTFRSILMCDYAIKRYITAHCLPSLFRGGIFLLPLVSVETVDARLQEFQTERQALVDAFMAEHPALVEQARLRLRRLFNPQEYPVPEIVRHSFSFSWRYVALRVPETLAAIDRQMFVREREKAARAWDEAAAAIQVLLRENMRELVQHMTERLTPGPDGKPRVFRDSAVNNLAEFLKSFNARNITDDEQLAAVVEQARRLLVGVEPAALRESEDVRDSVRRGFTEVKRNLDAMVTNRPARRIVLNRHDNAHEHAQQATAGINGQSMNQVPHEQVQHEPELHIAP